MPNKLSTFDPQVAGYQVGKCAAVRIKREYLFSKTTLENCLICSGIFNCVRFNMVHQYAR